YDHSNLNGGFVSPSLGVTYMLGKKTLLRAFIARGFNYAGIAGFTDNTVFGYKANPDLRPEKIMSYQAGIETSALEAVWLKLSAFRHDLKEALAGADVIDDPVFVWTLVNKGRQRRQGLEFEFRTAPVYNVSVHGGVVVADVKDLETGETIPGVPRYSYDLGIKYDDKKALRALLVGHYMWWNAAPWAMAHYKGFITDLHVIRNIFKKSNTSLEVFVSAHNIFDGTQMQSYASVIPKRWMEGGIRYKF
ncbi:MAG: TonB-dependent receptor, partial [Nitrospirae bacterium]|nr:TonB-dependent receptor [Nitrospirota bacterium]